MECEMTTKMNDLLGKWLAQVGNAWDRVQKWVLLLRSLKSLFEISDHFPVFLICDRWI